MSKKDWNPQDQGTKCSMACAHAVAASPTGAMAGASQLMARGRRPWLSRRAADDCDEAPPVEDNPKKGN